MLFLIFDVWILTRAVVKLSQSVSQICIQTMRCLLTIVTGATCFMGCVLRIHKDKPEQLL